MACGCGDDDLVRLARVTAVGGFDLPAWHFPNEVAQESPWCRGLVVPRLDGIGVRCGPLQISLRIDLVGVLAGAGGGRSEPHRVNAGVSELRVDLTAVRCVQVPSFGNHGFGDPLTRAQVLSGRDVAGTAFGYRRCISSSGSSSTRWSQVGQYHLASSGVPHAECRGASAGSA
jgi:hypothetical protein